MNAYMHTIDGKPGRFDGAQICYCSRRWPIVPVYSYSQILRERRASEKYMRKLFGEPNSSRYGHLIIKLQE